jgi:WD40 repeat protein/serine/threonine protein kinase
MQAGSSSQPRQDNAPETPLFLPAASSKGDFVLCCPHCHQPIPFDERASQQLICHECGSSIRVENYQPVSTIQEVRILGRFQLLECAGQGTFGAVWRAHDMELGRIVALKIPHSSLISSAAYQERFQREARAAAQLSHDGIVRLYEVPVVEGKPALVSEFIDGVSLWELMDVKPPTFRESAALVADVADALDYAHSKGLVHRDIKPGNIMVRSPLAPPLKPVIVDFGLALRAEAEIVMTVEGQIIGTPAYMSPEQARGDNRSVDGRSDVYSLGVVFYQLLCGELPFRGSKAMIVHQVLHEEPKPPRSINDKIPRDLETICLKAMAKEPGRRFPSAKEMAEDLHRFLRGELIRSRPAGKVERTYRWCRRNPWLALSSGGFALALIVGSITSTWLAILAHWSSRQATVNERKAIEAREMSERRLYVSEVNRAHEAWRNAQVGLALELIDHQRPEDGDGLVYRGFEWSYLKRICDPALRSFKAIGQGSAQTAFSSDFRLSISAGVDGSVTLRDLLSGEQVRLLHEANPIANTCVALSGDGRLAAAGGQNSFVRIWETENGRVRQKWSTQLGSVTSLAFDADSRWLAVGGGDGTLLVCETGTGREAARLPAHQGTIFCVAFSAKDSRLVSASTDHTAKVWDVLRGKELAKFQCATPLTSAAWSPDGRLIAVDGDSMIHVWEATTGNEVHSLSGHIGFIASLAFDRSGQRLASAGHDQRIKIWNLNYWQEDFAFRIPSQIGGGLSFDADGRRLAIASFDGTVSILDASSPQEYIPWKGDSYYVTRVEFSPDSTRLLSVNQDLYEHSFNVWDTATGQIIRTIREPRTNVRTAAWSPDGRLIASASDSWLLRSIPGEITIRDAQAGTVLKTFRAARGTIETLAFSRDGALLAWSEEQVVHLYDLRRQQEIGPLQTSGPPIKHLLFAADSRFIAIRSIDSSLKPGSPFRDQLDVWDLFARQKVKTLLQEAVPLGGLAFSTDGRWLAAADGTHGIRLWDTSSWDELLKLRGHSGLVGALAFSKDGRLATAGTDLSIRIWDFESRQSVLTLRSDTPIASLAFSRNGLRLASAGNDKVIRIWDATPLDPRSIAHRDALSLVRYLCGKDYTKEEIHSRIRADQTITEPVRERALALTDAYWDNSIRQQADTVVAHLTDQDQPWPKSDVIEKIRTDVTLGEAVRRQALALGEKYQEDPAAMNFASRRVLTDDQRQRVKYARALREAQRACELDPKNGSYRTTLGLAYYRLEHHDDALKALIHADQLNSADKGSSIPADLALLAMTQYQLGKKDDAKKTFERLREIMQSADWLNSAEAQAFFREAAACLQP